MKTKKKNRQFKTKESDKTLQNSPIPNLFIQKVLKIFPFTIRLGYFIADANTL